MKKVFIAFLSLFPAIAFAQQDSTLSLPIKNRIVFYEKEYAREDWVKANRYSRAYKWLTKAFPESSEAVVASQDLATGRISAVGIFKVVTGEPEPASGKKPAFYWVKFAVDIFVTDKGYLFQAHDFYEKPTEKGVTNDYSKVEYRWRDFVKGKPWSPGDRRLFEGLNQRMAELMASLEKQMK